MQRPAAPATPAGSPGGPAPPGQPAQAQKAALAGTTCMELALEGERLCKSGDFKSGVKFFEEALKVGTQDELTLSAIYSQLGNAYFYMEDYARALDHHQKDVQLLHRLQDQRAEAKACGNLGNTYKMLEQFDKAEFYCRRYLDISRNLTDREAEARALYNLGNVFHFQGKRMIGASAAHDQKEPGELSTEIKSCLQNAIDYYQANLRVVSELQDHHAMGRAYGNLGNTHYLLGNFQQAVDSHQKRLELAKKTNDKSAERRAYLNLGNANVFLSNYTEAINNYTATLDLAQELDDKYTEAHSCYSLANTYTLAHDYKKAVSFHLQYLDLIKEFDDKLGEGRACWSLVNIYHVMAEYESALIYARRHYNIAEQLGDQAGLVSAKLNIEELEARLGEKRANLGVSGQMAATHQHAHHHHQQHQHSLDEKLPVPTAATSANQTHRKLALGTFRLTPDKRQEQEQRRFKKQLNSTLAADIDGLVARRKSSKTGTPCRSSSSERLFDMIAHFQSGRIDDQRCEIHQRQQRQALDDKENLGSSLSATSTANTGGPRASQPSLANPISAAASALKATYRKASLVAYPSSAIHQAHQQQRRPTVSAEHRDQLFDLIATSQRQRMDEQRASLPALTLANGILKNPRNAGLMMNRGQSIDHSAPSTDGASAPSSSVLAKHRNSTMMPNTIAEVPASRKHKSHSITPAMKNPMELKQQQQQQQQHLQQQQSEVELCSTVAPKSFTHHKLTRHCQTVDNSDAQVHDEKFLDSLMKYQSTRFNDQRSEFPNSASLAAGSSATLSSGTFNGHNNNNNNNIACARQLTGKDDKDKDKERGNSDNFFNLIVRFQSDRIDDQRSAPPASNKNL